MSNLVRTRICKIGDALEMPALQKVSEIAMSLRERAKSEHSRRRIEKACRKVATMGAKADMADIAMEKWRIESTLKSAGVFDGSWVFSQNGEFFELYNVNRPEEKIHKDLMKSGPRKAGKPSFSSWSIFLIPILIGLACLLLM